MLGLILLFLVITVLSFFLSYGVFFKKNSKKVSYFKKEANAVLIVFMYIIYFFSFFFFFYSYNFNKNGLRFLEENIFKLEFYWYIDSVSVIFLFLSIILLIISFSLMHNKLTSNTFLFRTALLVFFIMVCGFFFTNNIIILVLFYEFFLIISFFIVNKLSSNTNSIGASLYFVIWTQLGSFLLVAATSYIVCSCGIIYLNDFKSYSFNKEEKSYIYTLLFIGLGIKVPIWPFHYWLTKTHVEATAGFSIYLSGFLVKTSLYCFYKIVSILGGDINTVVCVSVCAIGIVDASIKMWSQTDLKKLVAYCTIQEMNYIYLLINLGDSFSISNVLMFCVSHSLLSGLMFFLVDCVQKRYNTRSTTLLSGIMNTTPNLALAIIIMLGIYTGIPLTIKFSCEFYFFAHVFNSSFLFFFVILFIANFISYMSFCKHWLGILFGALGKDNQKGVSDLNSREVIIITLLVVLMVLAMKFNYIF